MGKGGTQSKKNKAELILISYSPRADTSLTWDTGWNYIKSILSTTLENFDKQEQMFAYV